MTFSTMTSDQSVDSPAQKEGKQAYYLKRGDQVNVYRDVWKTVSSVGRHGTLRDGYVEVRMTDGTTKVWFCSWKVGIRA